MEPDDIGKDAAICIRGLAKTYLDFWRRPRTEALRGLDLSVGRGEVFGLLGPNGSGKSTTIKVVLGLVRPTSGSVLVLSRPPDDVAVKRRIGYLPEVSNLHRFLTPRETLRYYAGLFGLDGATAHDRSTQLLEMVGLSKVADMEIAQFSKGMARRVGFAQALINDPDLLILDEPTSGLDPIASRAVKDWIRALAAAGKTVFMTSHLLADVEDVCDRVAIISDGLLRAEGCVSDLLSRPDALRFTVHGMHRGEESGAMEALEKATGRTVSVDSPRIDLETYFLDVVRASDAEDGGGRVRATDIAPFLAGRPVSGVVPGVSSE